MKKYIYENPDYIKINPKMKQWHITNKKKWCYVNVLVTDTKTGKEIKHIMGPYNRMRAEIIMNTNLSEGYCCWIEEDYLR